MEIPARSKDGEDDGQGDERPIEAPPLPARMADKARKGKGEGYQVAEEEAVVESQAEIEEEKNGGRDKRRNEARNLSFLEQEAEAGKTLGQSALVGSETEDPLVSGTSGTEQTGDAAQTDGEDGTQTSAAGDYFATARLNRQQARDSQPASADTDKKDSGSTFVSVDPNSLDGFFQEAFSVFQGLPNWKYPALGLLAGAFIFYIVLLIIKIRRALRSRKRKKNRKKKKK